jgi:hypothetical protein
MRGRLATSGTTSFEVGGANTAHFSPCYTDRAADSLWSAGVGNAL